MSADQIPAHRQFVACAFREGDKRTYTYHNDGAPVGPGDRVQVPGRSPGVVQTVIVAWITDVAPTFETKPIIGLAPAPGDEPPAAEGFDPVPQF